MNTSPRFLSFMLLLVGFLSGCATRPVSLSPMPEHEPFAVRTIPDAERLTLSVGYPKVETDLVELERGVSVQSGFRLEAGASVVISVPVETQDREQRSEGWGSGTQRFQTTGYFNLMEQQIERHLLGAGFDVIDRSKFEAILREQRRLVVEGAEGAVVAPVRKELVDMPELLRAAQSAPVQADYIFQVNDFVAEPMLDEVVNLAATEEFGELAFKHFGLAEAFEGDSTILKPGFLGVLNAKLIHVESGSIVWVGAHRVDTQHVAEFTMTVPIIKRVNNAAVVNGSIEARNAELEVAMRQLLSLKDTVSRLEVDGASRAEVEGAVAAYESALVDFMNSKAEEPEGVGAAWTYVYEVQPALVEPILPSAEGLVELEQRWAERAELSDDEARRLNSEIRLYRELLEQHFADLSLFVSRELIGTIPNVVNGE